MAHGIPSCGLPEMPHVLARNATMPRCRLEMTHHHPHDVLALDAACDRSHTASACAGSRNVTCGVLAQAKSDELVRMHDVDRANADENRTRMHQRLETGVGLAMCLMVAQRFSLAGAHAKTRLGIVLRAVSSALLRTTVLVGIAARNGTADLSRSWLAPRAVGTKHACSACSN
eukprot:3668416-Rhodomonas_salina.2